MKTRCGIVILLVALATVLFASMPAAAPAIVSLNSYEQQLVNRINKVRVSHHLATLRVTTSLVAAARSHSADMGARDYFAHNTLGGATWQQRISRFGYTRSGCSYYAVGENICTVGGLCAAFPQTTVDTTRKLWMNSPLHRAVILAARFRDVGVGVKLCGGTRYITLDAGRRIQ